MTMPSVPRCSTYLVTKNERQRNHPHHPQQHRCVTQTRHMDGRHRFGQNEWCVRACHRRQTILAMCRCRTTTMTAYPDRDRRPGLPMTYPSARRSMVVPSTRVRRVEPSGFFSNVEPSVFHCTMTPSVRLSMIVPSGLVCRCVPSVNISMTELLPRARKTVTVPSRRRESQIKASCAAHAKQK